MNLAMLKMLGISDDEIEAFKTNAAQVGQRVVDTETRVKQIEIDIACMRDEIAQVLTLLTEIVKNENGNDTSGICDSGNSGNTNAGSIATN